MTINEAAKVLDVPRLPLYYAVRFGVVPSTRTGGRGRDSFNYALDDESLAVARKFFNRENAMSTT